MNKAHNQRASEIIADNLYMTIATATPNGIPWVSPVYFAFDDQYNFYWVSAEYARHSQLIRANSQVAIAIFDSSVPEGDGEGVYVQAHAREIIEEKEIEHAHETICKRLNSEKPGNKLGSFSTSDYLGDSPQRIYGAKPEKIWLLIEMALVRGYKLDQRVEVHLS